MFPGPKGFAEHADDIMRRAGLGVSVEVQDELAAVARHALAMAVQRRSHPNQYDEVLSAFVPVGRISWRHTRLSLQRSSVGLSIGRNDGLA